MNTFSRVALAMASMTGLAAAQPKVDPRPADPRPAPRPAAPKPPEPGAGGMPDKPPAELAGLAKAATGTWHCRGQSLDRTRKLAEMSGTLKNKLDLDGWWLTTSFESRTGKDSFHFESFTTFDPGTKKWKRVMVESRGQWASGESDGMTDSKIDWELAAHSAMGEFTFRDHEDLSDPKAGAKLWGERSIDKGMTWTKVYEMVCKK